MLGNGLGGRVWTEYQVVTTYLTACRWMLGLCARGQRARRAVQRLGAVTATRKARNSGGHLDLT